MSRRRTGIGLPFLMNSAVTESLLYLSNLTTKSRKLPNLGNANSTFNLKSKLTHLPRGKTNNRNP